MEMTPERWEATNQYTRDLFGPDDPHLTKLVEDAVEAGLPEIAVSHDVGRLLKILTQMTGARLAVEVGTLGGYSGTWIARGLGADGRLVTIEADAKHADFAREHFDAGGLSDRVEVRHGPGVEVLKNLSEEVGEASVDLGFVDANKDQYPQYFELLRPLIRPGGFFVADNALGSGAGWVDDLSQPMVAATDQMNRAVVSDPDFESVMLSVREGVLVARKKG